MAIKKSLNKVRDKIDTLAHTRKGKIAAMLLKNSILYLQTLLSDLMTNILSTWFKYTASTIKLDYCKWYAEVHLVSRDNQLVGKLKGSLVQWWCKDGKLSSAKYLVQASTIIITKLKFDPSGPLMGDNSLTPLRTLKMAKFIETYQSLTSLWRHFDTNLSFRFL